jgi:hypothetical protein
MLVGDGLVTGGRRIHEKLCSDDHDHRGSEMEGDAPHILGEIIDDLLKRLS